MRAVVQRVSEARVEVAGEVVGAIGRGLLVLVGVRHGDGPADADATADKIAVLRIFADAQDRMNRSVADVDGGVLVVSQFTLYASVARGRRPSFTEAAPPEEAAPLVDRVVARLRERGLAVETGRFGARMAVASVNDGPVTVLIETVDGRVR